MLDFGIVLVYFVVIIELHMKGGFKTAALKMRALITITLSYSLEGAK